MIAKSDIGKIKQNNGRPRESPEPQPPPLNSPLLPTLSSEIGFSSFVPTSHSLSSSSKTDKAGGHTAGWVTRCTRFYWSAGLISRSPFSHFLIQISIGLIQKTDLLNGCGGLNCEKWEEYPSHALLNILPLGFVY